KLFTTLRVNSPSFSGRIVPLFDVMLVSQGEGSGTPTKPHHTPSSVAQTPSHTTQPTSSLLHVSITSIPTVTPTDTTPIRQYTRRARIDQSSALPPVADEPASPVKDVSQGEACPTDSSFIADQDRVTIAKSSTLPHDSAPRVTSSVADEGSMQPNITELTVLCTSLQRQHSELLAKFQAQEVEILKLKEKVKVLEDREGIAATRSGDDAPINGRSMDEGEATTKRISDDKEEMVTVLTSIDAATVLAGELMMFPLAVVPFPLLQKRDYYMAVIKNNLGWKVKDFKGMTFKEVEAKFNSVYKRMEDFIPMGSKEEAERYKRKGITFDQESLKKLKSSEEVIEEAKSTNEIPEEKIKEMMQLIPIEEVYVEVIQVKHPIINWKKLYDLSGVHQVTAKYKEIFMLVEKDYPLKKGLALVMICYKLQVENFSQMANDLVLKIYKIANSPRQKFSLPEGTSHCLKKNATARIKVMPLPEDCTATKFKVFNRCLKPRTSRHDQTKINILQIFHVVVNRVYVSYVGLLWWDFLHCVQQKKDVIHYPRFTKLIIYDLMKKFLSIPKRLGEDYHSIKDNIPLVSVYTTGNVTVKGTLIPDDFLTDDIRATPEYKTPTPATVVEDVVQKKKRKQEKLMEEDIKKMVDDEDEDSYASKFAYSVFINKEDNSGTRIDPESHKENLKTVDDDDDGEEKKDDKKDDDNNDDDNDDDDNDDDDNDDDIDHTLFKDQVIGSSKTRKEKMQTPIPSPHKSSKTDLSSDKTIS
nr:hypothetical protein [Tanacetum cinerariifolium]